MPKMDLLESHVFQGKIYGPGQQVDLPNVRQFIERVQQQEGIAQERMRRAAAQSMMALPSGHPYRQMFPQVSTQPPEFEGEASTPTSHLFQSADLDSRALMPDGWTVSGTNAPSGAQEAFARGVQAPTEFDLSGANLGQQLGSVLGSYPPGQGQGERNSQLQPPPVDGFANTPNSTAVTPLAPEEASPTPNPTGSMVVPVGVQLGPQGSARNAAGEPLVDESAEGVNANAAPVAPAGEGTARQATDQAGNDEQPNRPRHRRD